MSGVVCVGFKFVCEVCLLLSEACLFFVCEVCMSPSFGLVCEVCTFLFIFARCVYHCT